MKQATRIQFAIGLAAVDASPDQSQYDGTEQTATTIAHSLLCSAYGGASVHYGLGIWAEKPGATPTIERTIYFTADTLSDLLAVGGLGIASGIAQQLAKLFKQRAAHVSYWPITTGDIYHENND